MFVARDGDPVDPLVEERAHLDELRAQPTADLEETFRQLVALEAAVQAELLQVLAALDERDVGREDGSADTVAWTAESARVTRAHARQMVETARALVELPAVMAAAGAGRLSWDQLEPLAQVATPATDEEWADRASGWTPSQLARAARAERAVTAEEACDRLARRSLTWWWDSQNMLRIRGRLPDVMGATIVRALERIAEPVTQDADGQYEPFDVRCADALGELASQRLVDDAEPDRACVVVHAPVAALIEGSTEPGAELAGDDVSIANETVRRLACDATLQPMFEAPDGSAVAAGRRTRTIPAAMRRRVMQRDRHCRFPGCDRTRGVQVHHAVHHADDGVTELWNLVLLCPQHHRFLHEHRWRIKGDPGRPDGLEFHAPDGRRLGGPLPPLRPDIRTRILEPA